jgi:hypothetical protein
MSAFDHMPVLWAFIHVSTSAVNVSPVREQVRGATIERRKSQKSVEWSSKVMGKNQRWRKSMRNPSWSL